MSSRAPFVARAVLIAFAAVSCLAPAIPASAQQAQNPPPPDPEKPAAQKPAKPLPAEPVTIYIELTGGEKDKPIENASVYVRYNEPHKFKSDKLIEMNVKTSMTGKVKVPLVPIGKILIQVVADGWKTYGRWHDLTEDGQVFKIHLDRPHRWY